MGEFVNEVLPKDKAKILTNSSLIKVGERYYETKPLLPSEATIEGFFNKKDDKMTDFKLENGIELRNDIAYLLGDYYFLYRGKTSNLNPLKTPEPGIYYDDSSCNYLLCYPETPEEIEQYKYIDKITTYDADEIRNAVLSKKVIIYNIPENIKSAIPPESMTDNILKKLSKRAFFAKEVDIDQCKSRFISKNTLFNYKSVLKSENPLSMMLFDRGMDALNLKYTIILEEAGGEIVGKPLSEPIILSSGDVYQSYLDASE